MNSEQINNSDKLIQDMFSDMEIPTTEQDWQLMKKSLGTSTVGTSTKVGSTGASSSILPVLSKGLILTTIGAVLLVSSIFYFYNFDNNNSVSESLSSSTNEINELVLLSENTSTEKSQGKNYSEDTDFSNDNNLKNTSKAPVDNSIKTGSFTQDMHSNVYNAEPLTVNNRDYDYNANSKNSSVEILTDSKVSKYNIGSTDNGFKRQSTMDKSIVQFNEKSEEYLFLEEDSKAKGLLGAKYKENRSTIDFGSLANNGLKDLLYNSKEINLTLPNESYRRKLKLTERFDSYLIIGLRSRAIPHPLDTEYESTEGVHPLAHFIVGMGLRYKFNNSISLSTSVSHLRVIAPQLIYISERYTTTIPITTLDWRFKRTVDAIYGIEIPLHLNFSPQSKYKLIDNLSLTAGLTSVISAYVKTIDEELIETVGSFSAEQPQGWEAPSKFEGIKKFDLGIALGFSYKIHYNSEVQLMYNYGFGKFVDDEYYSIDDLYNRNKNIQLTLKYGLK